MRAPLSQRDSVPKEDTLTITSDDSHHPWPTMAEKLVCAFCKAVRIPHPSISPRLAEAGLSAQARFKCVEKAMKYKTLAIMVELFIISLGAIANAQSYSVTDLGHLSPAAINNLGQVVGDYNGHAAYVGDIRRIT
jgi:hypothetical protein